MQLNKNNTVKRIFDFKNKCVGIWGYGVTGSAAVNYFEEQSPQRIIVLNEKLLNSTAQEILTQKNITVYTNAEQKLFFDQADYIIKSPGITCYNLQQEYKQKNCIGI